MEDLNVRPKALKLPEGNTDSTLHDIDVGKDFLELSLDMN